MNGPVPRSLAGTRPAGWALIVPPPVWGFPALLSILACLRGPARCHAAATAPGCRLIPLESLARTRLVLQPHFVTGRDGGLAWR